MSWSSALSTMFPGGRITFNSNGTVNDFRGHWNRPGRQRHSATNGVDISKRPKGSQIYSPIEGIVIRVARSYGIVAVRDKEGNIHRFLHLSMFDVKEGDHVKVGTRIGREGGIGQSGTRAYAIHLHYDVDIKGQGYYVDPVEWWSGNVDPGEPDPSPKNATKDEDAQEEISKVGGDTQAEVESKKQSPRTNSTVSNIGGSPSRPANVGASSEYAPRRAARSQASNAGYALWTNRVPLHEPWPRVLMDNETTNEFSAGPNTNVRHHPQFADDGTPETSGKIGRIDELVEYDRGKFWRR